MASREDDARRRRIDVDLPSQNVTPLRKILRRLAVALGLIFFVALITYLGRDGYYDPEGDGVSLLDSFYYSTVSITTTGYGDIRPVTDEARLMTTILVTPARVLFLIILVGTTLEVLAEHSRRAFRQERWRRRLSSHTIVCGYGTKGRAAIRTLCDSGVPADQIVVIELDAEERRRASAEGYAAVAGDAAEADVLEEAKVHDADAVIVAVNRDDAAVLITLTVRELAPGVRLVAAAREEENVHLLRQSGATSVITSSAAAGRLLGLGAKSPRVTEILEDLLTVGEGLDLEERPIGAAEAGPLSGLPGSHPVIAVVRGDEVIRFDDERAEQLFAGDHVVQLVRHRG